MNSFGGRGPAAFHPLPRKSLGGHSRFWVRGIFPPHPHPETIDFPWCPLILWGVFGMGIGVGRFIFQMLVVCFELLDFHFLLWEENVCNVPKTIWRGSCFIVLQEGAFWMLEIGVKHATDLDNHRNSDVSIFRKWNFNSLLKHWLKYM